MFAAIQQTEDRIIVHAVSTDRETIARLGCEAMKGEGRLRIVPTTPSAFSVAETHRVPKHSRRWYIDSTGTLAIWGELAHTVAK